MKTRILESANILQPLMVMWSHEANKSFGIDIDVNISMQTLQKMVDNEGSDVIGLFNDKGIIGYIGIMSFANPIGKGKYANEHLWYVHPDHRGSMGSLRLIGGALEWAKEHGCTQFILNASELASSMHDRVCALYEKLGLRRFETSYIIGIEV